MKFLLLLLILPTFFNTPMYAQNSNEPIKIDTDSTFKLTLKGASHFAQLALKCMHQEYPNKTGHVIMNSSDVKPPRQLHPAFYGCFDWHSSVHGHWMLVKLLKLYPDLPEAKRIRKALTSNLDKDKLIAEADYFNKPGAKTFERTYGWAWLLKLVGELHTWHDPDGMIWRDNLRPLEQVVIKRYFNFLPKQTYPNRTGEHPNTAFGMSFAWDYALTTDNDLLLNLLKVRALDYFFNDQLCPAGWEPGGSDFLSPCLEEADLMQRVLSFNDFRKWLSGFLPGIENGRPAALFTPANVSDRTDPKIVHLDGLNLSRAWCFYNINKKLNLDDKNRDNQILHAANAHILATLPYIASGNYGGEHWLASFAVYTLSIEH